jgi:ribokinase
MKSSILVIGSTNTDMVVKADRLPAPGETVIGGSFFMSQGGKGANQAVAAQRLGGDVTFIFKTGKDIFGERSVQLFEREGINIDHRVTDAELASGVALITVDKKAENCIAVASGANGTLTPADIAPAKAVIETASVILMQLEIPIETVSYVAGLAAARSCTFILNPAPACALPASLLKNVSVVTPNEKEAEMLSGITIVDDQSVRQAASVIREKGVDTVIITLGSRGAFISSDGMEQFIPAIKVDAVDTTAAGDVFNGALAVALSEGKVLEDAVRFACRAAAISVTRLGAQTAAPYRGEVEDTQFKPS